MKVKLGQKFNPSKFLSQQKRIKAVKVKGEKIIGKLKYNGKALVYYKKQQQNFFPKTN